MRRGDDVTLAIEDKGYRDGGDTSIIGFGFFVAKYDRIIHLQPEVTNDFTSDAKSSHRNTYHGQSLGSILFLQCLQHWDLHSARPAPDRPKI